MMNSGFLFGFPKENHMIIASISAYQAVCLSKQTNKRTNLI